MERSYLLPLSKYLHRKIILISGPRQSGKTTIAKMLTDHYDYLNFDNEDDRAIFKAKAWDRKKKIIILDELHKMPKWKQWLKGIYDVEGNKPSLVVTGSARIESYKKVGDSLAGRYFHYRVHPLDVRELVQMKSNLSPHEINERILEVSGFPEPFLEGSKAFYQMWKKTHLDIILKQDLVDLEVTKSIKQIELLVDLLKTKIGSAVSYSSLAQYLQVSDKTIKHWLEILEDMYVIFKITPYSKNIARSILKRPKYYFYDVARVSDQAARLENLVACSLIKEIHFRQDCFGEDWGLNFLSKKDKAEIDFFITHENKPWAMIEVKTSDDVPTKNFKLFGNDLSKVKAIQLVQNLVREKTYPNGTEVRKLADWLVNW